MREITPSDKPRRLRWIRGADGRVKRADDGRTIGDIWAEQRRVRLAESIERDKRAADKRATRRALFGKFWANAKKALSNSSKWRSITPWSALSLRSLFRRLSKKQVLVGGGAVVVLLFLLITGPNVSSTLRKNANHKAVITKTGVLAGKTEKPSYDTVLPAGKKIEDFGGWARVSPPDKNPVFAYADKIAGVHITVSEQPLPDSFKQDVKSSVADLAKQFSANDVVTTDKLTFYVGTSIKGPQSVIVSVQDLLVLIKSDTKLTNQQWADYISSLH